MENARADYCLAVKMNQSKTAEAIETAFNSDNEAKCGTVKDKDHGREEVRTTYVLPGKLLPASILKNGTDCNSAVSSSRSLNGRL